MTLLRMIGVALPVVALTAMAGAAPSASGSLSQAIDPVEFLRTAGGFSRAELGLLESGQPVARVLDTERREVAIAGAIRLDAPIDRLLAHYRDVSLMRRSAAVQEVGVFGATPSPDDLRGLTFEDYDLDAIATCVPGDCAVRLSAPDMERFKREVDFRAADWRRLAGETWRRILSEYAAGYLRNGDRTLAEYRNKEVPLSVAQEFALLFDESGFFVSVAPEFMRGLREFPRARPEGVADVLYWTKDSFGVRPVVSITHLQTYKRPANRPASQALAVIAAKQIYATHYFDAGLGLTAVFPHPSGGLYLVSINRARTRSLTSFLRLPVRRTVQNRSREAMEKILRSTKTAVEQRVSTR